jgi:hypothetical protein
MLTHSGVSRQFGFLQFPDIEHATVFLDRHHPSILLQGRNHENATVSVAYSRERDDRGREMSTADWICGNVKSPIHV